MHNNKLKKEFFFFLKTFNNSISFLLFIGIECVIIPKSLRMFSFVSLFFAISEFCCCIVSSLLLLLLFLNSNGFKESWYGNRFFVFLHANVFVVISIISHSTLIPKNYLHRISEKKMI